MILKKSVSKKVDLDKIIPRFAGCSIEIDYPTIEQMERLRELFFQLIFNNPEIAEKIDNEDLTIEQRAKQLRISEQIAKLRIKYSIKGWDGFIKESGEPILFNLVKDEMEKNLYEMFVSNLTYDEMIALGNFIQNETEFSETDKKK